MLIFYLSKNTSVWIFWRDKFSDFSIFNLLLVIEKWYLNDLYEDYLNIFENGFLHMTFF